MGRRWLEARAKNAQGKTTEGVGRGRAWLREGKAWAFLGANTLHLEWEAQGSGNGLRAVDLTSKICAEWPPPQ